MIVLDANAAVEIARATEVGNALLSLTFSGEKVIAPSLFRYELTNAFWKYVRAGVMEQDDAMWALREMLDYVSEFVDCEELVPEVLSESVSCKHSVYDMFYLILARRNGATLFTMDKKLNALCDQLHVNHVFDVQLDD